MAKRVLPENIAMTGPSSVALLNQPGFDFIQRVPTEWDEIRFLAGEASNFLVIARGKDQDWYIAAMTDSSKRTLEILLTPNPN
jgi:alpha-glucosidase